MLLSAVISLFACVNEDAGDTNPDEHECPTPSLTVGENGNWFLDGVDTGIQATTPITVTDTALEFKPIDGVDSCVVTITFSDGSSTSVSAPMPAPAPAPEVKSTKTETKTVEGVEYYAITITFTDDSTKEVLVAMPTPETPKAPTVSGTSTGTETVDGTDYYVITVSFSDSTTKEVKVPMPAGAAPDIKSTTTEEKTVEGVEYYAITITFTDDSTKEVLVAMPTPETPKAPTVSGTTTGTETVEGTDYYVITVSFSDNTTEVVKVPMPAPTPAPEITGTSAQMTKKDGKDFCIVTITYSDGTAKVLEVEVTDPNDGFTTTAIITNGYGGTNGIICLMTDNDSGKFETLALLDELYIKYGLVGGLGTVVKNLYNDSAYQSPKASVVEKWQEFLDTGRWSIINHSMTHTTYCDFVDGERVVNRDRLYMELVESAEKLRELFPGERVLTYAMTGTQSALGNNASTDPDNIRQAERDLIAEYYVGGRFLGSGAVAFDNLQWNNLPYALLSRGNLNTILKNIDKAAQEGMYYMVYNHYVIEDELFDTVNESSWTNLSTAEALCQRVSQYVKDGSIWCAQFEDAVMYMRERQTATLTASYKDGKITVLLSDEMDDTVYNHKLTVRLTVPENYEAVKVTQGTDISYAEVRFDGTEYYALVNILPDGGEATVEPVMKTDMPEIVPEAVKPTPDIGKSEAPTVTVAPDVYTFDSIDGMVGGVIIYDNGSDFESVISVVEDGASKVLKIVKPAGDHQPTLTIAGKQLADATSFVAEFDLKLERTSSGGEMYLGLKDGKGNFAYRGYIQITGTNTIKFTDYASGSSVRNPSQSITTNNGWVTLKLIYTVASDGKANIALIANGTEVLTSTNHYISTSTPIDPSQIKFLNLNFSKSLSGNIYLDDVILKGTSGEIEPDEPVTPEAPEHKHEFVDGKCTCGESDPNYTPTTPPSASDADFTFDSIEGLVGNTIMFSDEGEATLSVVTDGTEKVLKFEKPSGTANPAVSFVTTAESGAKTFVIETDIKIDRTSTKSEFYVQISDKTLYGYSYRAYFTVNGGSISFVDYNKGSTITNTASSIAQANEWFKLRIEYSAFDDGTASIKTYVGENLVLDSTNHHFSTDTPPATDTMCAIKFNAGSGFTGNVYFDNLSLYYKAQ